ncbi:MAG: recombinase family protein [Defluviitaleaceae bacterium]|nr:recombinase family protein [Defluviitaleaceae bacterium]MCL2239637.1 recombinase family protein [Defluviitaleaceae bacterium]
MKIYGYCRVSTAEQNEARQLDALAGLGISPAYIYVDKQSGKDFRRPQWTALVRQLTPGDLLYVHSIDRLGRNYEEIQQVWRALTKQQSVDIAVITMPLLDTRREKDLVGTFLTDVVLQILSFVAQNERENIRTRQAEGITAAKSRGVKFGRPIKKPPENFAEVVAQWEDGAITFDEALTRTGLKQATFYNRLRELRAQQEDSQL